MFERALYYPSIDIYNDRWLKSAILFWDRIETIVPESINQPYRRRNTRILEDEGILIAYRVNPFMEDIRGIEQDVVTYINTKEGKKSFRKPWLRSAAHNKDGIEDGERFLLEQKQKLIDKYQDFYIHVDKLPLILRNQLVGHQDNDGFVWARKGFMTFYMTLLANRICRNNDMALLTESVNFNSLSNRIFTDVVSSVEGNDDDEQTRRGMMYQIAMDDIKIAPSTPIEDIIRFRRDRQQELARFREEMNRLTDFDTDGMSQKDFEHEVKRIYDHEVVPAMNNVKTTLNEARINWLSGTGTCLFTGLIPMAFSLDISSASGVITGISQGIGLALTSLPMVRQWQARRSPYSYLIKIKQEFSIHGRKNNIYNDESQPYG